MKILDPLDTATHLCVSTRMTTTHRFLRGLPVVGIHARALVGVVLLGSCRRPLWSIAGPVHWAVFHSFLISRLRHVYCVCMGCCMQVRDAYVLLEFLSRQVINVSSPFLFSSRSAAQCCVSWLTCLSTHLSHDRAITKKGCSNRYPRMQKIRRHPPSIVKPFARNESAVIQEARPLLLHSSLPADIYKPTSLRRRRFLTGAMSGIVGTARTMISEVCGSEHEVVGMSFLAGDVTAELQ